MKSFNNHSATFDNLKKFSNNFKERNLVCDDWYPSMEDIKKEIEPNFEQYAVFVYWILETATFPETPEGNSIKSALLDLFLKNIDIKTFNKDLFFISSLKKIDINKSDTDIKYETVTNEPSLYERLAYLQLKMQDYENKRKERLLISNEEE